MTNLVNFISKLKNIGYSFQEWLYFCKIVHLYNIHDFGLCASIFISDFQFVGETGSKSRKQSINRFRGVGWHNGFLGGLGWGDTIQTQTSPDFRFPEVDISVHTVE